MKRLLLTLCLLALPALVHAQTQVDPNKFEFTPSLQHDSVNPLDGLPVVTSYDVLIYTQAAPAVVLQSYNCGKPTPVLPTGAPAGSPLVVPCTIPQTVKDALPKNVILVAKERANGQAGITPALSAAGGPFGFAGPVSLTAGGPPQPKP